MGNMKVDSFTGDAERQVFIWALEMEPLSLCGSSMREPEGRAPVLVTLKST